MLDKVIIAKSVVLLRVVRIPRSGIVTLSEKDAAEVGVSICKSRAPSVLFTLNLIDPAEAAPT